MREDLRNCGLLVGCGSGHRQVLHQPFLVARSELLQLVLRIRWQFGWLSFELLLVQIELSDCRTLGLASGALSLLKHLLEHTARVGPPIKQDWVEILAPLR